MPIPVGSDIYLILPLIILAVLIGIISDRLKVSFTSSLLVFGILLAALNGYLHIFSVSSIFGQAFSSNIFFGLVLPPILYKGALDLNFRKFKEMLIPITFLATFGVIVSILIIGFLLKVLIGLPLVPALLFGAIISPTDPVGVISFMKRVNVPSGLSAIIEGESLLNDGVAVVAFSALLGYLGGSDETLSNIVSSLARTISVGIVVGVILGLAYVYVIKYLKDPNGIIALSLVIAYSSFEIAQQLNASGILAVVISAIIIGNSVKERNKGVADLLSGFWSVINYIMLAIVFITMGLFIDPMFIIPYILLIIVAFFIVTGARGGIVYIFHRIFSGGFESPEWSTTIALSGIRGAIPLVLALNLPQLIGNTTFQYREPILALTIGVILISLLGQSYVAERYTRKRLSYSIEVRHETARGGTGGA